MLFQNTIPVDPFKKWMWQDKENKRLLILSALAMIVSFTWLKILYPFPNFMPPDSNSYVEAAINNQFINIWAIGYSKFLRLISSFSNSHFVLVMLQYIILQTTILYFLFTIRYFISPGKWLFRILLATSVINPLLVHISNYVASDSIFISLSITWLTQLIWIIYNPKTRNLIWHGIIVLLAFMVRYNAIYYPLISIAVIALSNANKRKKVIGIGIIILLVGSFIGRTQYEYYKVTGTVQYSAFGGWQLAANALYGYAYANPDDIQDIPIKFYDLNKLVIKHMESLRRYPPFLRPDKEVAVYYLWDFKSPLRVYMEQKVQKDTSFLKRWASVAPLYSAYGRFLIMKHPKEFIKYYLWPNFIKYYTPPTKFMGAYNMGKEKVAPVIGNFFGWKSNNLPAYFKNRTITITEPFPIVFAILNIAFILSILSFWALGGFRQSNIISKRIIYLIIAIWISNMAFSVFAAPIELRYQIFPLVILLAYSWLILSYVWIQALTKPVTDLTTQGLIQPV